VQVKKLGAQLTSTDDSLRYKGTLVLAEVRSRTLALTSPCVLRGVLLHCQLLFAERSPVVRHA